MNPIKVYVMLSLFVIVLLASVVSIWSYYQSDQTKLAMVETKSHKLRLKKKGSAASNAIEYISADNFFQSND
jgi:hypothetical protein